MANMTAKYERNPGGWAEIIMSPDILDACLAEAKRGKVYAISISPRSGDGKGKPFADSFSAIPSVTHDFRGGPRVMAYLMNDSDHSAAVEFGNKHSRPHRILGRTAAYLGGA